MVERFSIEKLIGRSDWTDKRSTPEPKEKWMILVLENLKNKMKINQLVRVINLQIQTDLTLFLEVVGCFFDCTLEK